MASQADRYREKGKEYYFLQPRASMLGKTEDEIYKFFTNKDAVDEESPGIMSADVGNTLHRLFQAQDYTSGKISTAEYFVHNREYAFTGHIDAISPTMGIGDYKTVSNKALNKIRKYGARDYNVSQVNAYMATMGIKKGYLQYVSREDPSNQHTVTFNFDPELFKRDMEKLKRVQNRIKEELASGRLTYDMLNQGSNLETLEEEAKSSKQDLIKDTSRIDELINSYLYLEKKMEKSSKKQSQSLSQRGMTTNKAINPVSKREDRNTIPGMAHGWFGSQRSSNTDFGSPYRMGDKYHNAVSGLLDEQINDFFNNPMGLDIETTSLKGGPNSLFQVGLSHGDNKFSSLFVQQKNNELTPFLNETFIGKTLKGELGVDFSKKGDVADYSSYIFGEKERAMKRIVSQVVAKEQVKEAIQVFMATAKAKRKNVFIMNANFEIDHIQHLFGDRSSFNYTSEYLKLRAKIRNESSYDRAKLNIGKITEDVFFSNEVARQKELYTNIVQEMHKRRGSIIEVQEIAKTLQAVSQEKGLVPRTGNFSTGTNIENLASILLGKAELHEGASDAYQQERIAERMTRMIRDIEVGKINKDNVKILSGYSGSYFKAWNENLSEIFESSTRKKIESELMSKGHLYDIDPLKKGTSLLSNSPINEVHIFESAKSKIKPELKPLLNSFANVDSEYAAIEKTGIIKKGAIALMGGIALAAALKNVHRFSGRDDESNTIEGMNHRGLAQYLRKQNTDFGSGFQMQNYHDSGNQDPSSLNLNPLLTMGGVIYGSKFAWNIPTSVKINDLSYLGRLSPDRLNSEVLGRETATAGDIALAALKRAEASLGGFPKAFGLSDVLGTPAYQGAEFRVNLFDSKNVSYAKYMDALTKRKLADEGFDAFSFSKGKITLHGIKGDEVLRGNYNLIRLAHDLNINESLSQHAKSALRIHGVDYIDPKANPFIPIGGEDFLESSPFKRMHVYAHEAFTKYVQLMDSPLDAFKNLFPDINHPTYEKAKKLFDYVPKLGVGGEEGLKGPLHQVVGRHALRLGAYGGAAYLAYGTLNWMAKSIAPDGTIVGDAGITGLGAEALRTVHQTYAKLSDVTGLTYFRDKMEQVAPGMEGWAVPIGMGFSGALAGAGLATIEDVSMEGLSKNHYQSFLKAREANEEMPKLLKGLPGFKGKYTKVGKYARVGAAIGVALASPWLLSGLGADKSYDQLQEEYEGKREVAIRKGRWWESSLAPWKGEKIEYFRPNWYARLRDDAKTKELYDGENISPVGRILRNVIDPYWLERRRYEEQPYPYVGPDGSALGIFGPIYEATIGRVIKPPAMMHQSEFKNQMDRGSDVSAEAGGLGIDPVSPNSLGSLARKQWSSLLEAMGLRGFMGKSIEESALGEGGYKPEYANAARMDSIVASYQDLQLGGGALTTEAIRRVLQDTNRGITTVNPLKNRMPSWMPGEGYFINFHEGDPYAKVKEGYYRLPGEGFASRYEDLKGMNPEDYPDIYKYKILSDVAPTSQQFKKIKAELEQRSLTADELRIWNEVREQNKEKEESLTVTRDSSTYDTILGTYSAILSDVARTNPMEQMLPFSPAHKFLSGQDPIDAYEESIYGQPYRNWANPIEDFVAPAARMLGHSLGMNIVPEKEQERTKIDDYFDKLEYVKNMKLAEEARASGDQGTANIYESKAARTLSAIDPYADLEELKMVIPQRERNYIDSFVNAPVEDRESILRAATPTMRDIYQAQWDKQDLDILQTDNSGIDDETKNEAIQNIQNRMVSVQAQRKARLQDFKRSPEIPPESWGGWKQGVDMKDVKMQYLVNTGRDYHYYGMWKDRYNMLSRKPYVQNAAENLSFTPVEHKDKYVEAYERAKNAGILDPRIIIVPGLESGIDAEIEVKRDEERRATLRNLGYIQ